MAVLDNRESLDDEAELKLVTAATMTLSGNWDSSRP